LEATENEIAYFCVLITDVDVILVREDWNRFCELQIREIGVEKE
jgi:hypothetical protein